MNSGGEPIGRDDTVGIIVAGGAGTRMSQLSDGTNKATLVFEGRTFLQRVIRAMAGHVSRIVVVAAEGQDLGDTSAAVPVTVIRDSIPGAGPLSAVADGLDEAIAQADRRRRPAPRRAFVASCDVPRLSERVVRQVLDHLQGGVDWAVPTVHGHPQVLVSAIQTTILPKIRGHLGRGRRDLRGLLQDVAVRTIDEASLRAADPQLASFLDIDTDEEFERLRGPDREDDDTV